MIHFNCHVYWLSCIIFRCKKNEKMYGSLFWTVRNLLVNLVLSMDNFNFTEDLGDSRKAESAEFFSRIHDTLSL